MNSLLNTACFKNARIKRNKEGQKIGFDVLQIIVPTFLWSLQFLKVGRKGTDQTVERLMQTWAEAV